MMNLLQLTSDEEPKWDFFSTSGCDFRPHWDGNLINVFTTIRSLADLETTQAFAIECARQLASWVLSERHQFGVGDKFQIIIGWSKDARPSSRQILKTGGDYTQLAAIVSSNAPVNMHGDWTTSVFADGA